MYFCAFVVVLHHQLYSLIFNYFLNERNLESTMNVKDYVVQELESYPRTLRQIAVLRYELEHPVQVSTEEMLDAMAFARGEHFGVAPGHVSDKTLYIAMNYRQKANEVNAEISGEISAKLLELEHKKNRIEYYVGMLDSRKAEIIRLCFFKGMTIEEDHLYGGMPLEPLALSVDSSICGSFLVADCPYFHIPSQLSSAKK